MVDAVGSIPGCVDALQDLGAATAQFWLLAVALPLVACVAAFAVAVGLLIHWSRPAE
jgi:hypothetical protein